MSRAPAAVYRDSARPAAHPDEDQARSVLASALAPGETLLWANRPKRGFMRDPNASAFWKVIWTVFAANWVGYACLADLSWTAKLVAVPFVVIGFYGLFGRCFVDAAHRQRLNYGITNRRLLVATASRLVAAPSLGELRTHVVKREGGVGDLHVESPRLVLRAVPDVASMHLTLVEAQIASSESNPS